MVTGTWYAAANLLKLICNVDFFVHAATDAACKLQSGFKQPKRTIMRTVKEILASKATLTNVIEPTKLIIEGLQLLNSVNLSYLVVMEGDEYKGIFSEKDYARNVVLKGHSSKDTMIREVMTTDLPVVSLTDTLEHCMNRMNTHRTRYILAYDNKSFKGVITIHDLLRQVLANKEDAFDHTLTRNLIDSDERGRIF